QRLDQGEAAVLERLAGQLPQSDLDEQTRADLAPWLAWTTERTVRHAPAKSYCVAQFVLDQSATGATTESILRQVNAISALHQKFGLADPTATSATRWALETSFNFGPAPRSWTRPEQEIFVTLPVEVRAAISRREHQREKEVRRLQNSIADLKRQ